jgi:HD superfamily phosphohydrolase
MSDNDLFKGTGLSIDPEKDYSAELIGEGKKYATLKDAARAILEKDVFIDQLKVEKKEVLEDLSKRMTMEEAISKLKETDTRNTQQADQNSARGSDQTVTEETMNKLIQEAVQRRISETNSESEAKRNMDMVKQTLTEKWGQDFVSTLKTKSAELGVSEQWVTETAQKTPQVLLKLLDSVTPKSNQADGNIFTTSGNGVNSAALSRKGDNTPQEGKYSYWQTMRKENPTAYHSPAISLQRHNAAIKYGEAFYDKT